MAAKKLTRDALEKILKEIENDPHDRGICSKTKKPYEAQNLGLMGGCGRLIGPPYGMSRLYRYTCSGCGETQYYSARDFYLPWTRSQKISEQSAAAIGYERVS